MSAVWFLLWAALHIQRTAAVDGYSGYEPLKWGVTVVPTAGVQSVGYLLPNASYRLQVAVYYAADGSPCQDCTAELFRVGGHPVLTATGESALANIAALATQPDLAPSPPTASTTAARLWWEFGLTTAAAASGMLRITVGDNGLRPARVDMGVLRDEEVALSVGWFAGILKTDFNIYKDGSTSTTSPDSTIDNLVVNINPSITPIAAIGSGSSTSASSRLLLSQDGFQTFSELQIQTGTSDADPCGAGSKAPFLYQAALTWSSILLHTKSGLLAANASTYGSGGALWAPLLAGCIASVTFPTQSAPFNCTDCLTTVAVGGGSQNGRLWAVRRGLVVELLDAAGKPFALGLGFPSGTPVIAGAAFASNTTECIFLATVDGRYRLFQFDGALQVWNAIFAFPASIPTVLSGYTVVYSGVELETTGTGFAPLTLSGLAIHNSHGHGAFFWGNALLYSPNGGLAMILLATFTNGVTVKFFTGSENGYFAFTTSDNQLFVGHVGSGEIIQVKPSRPSSSGTSTLSYRPVYDAFGNLQELILSKTASGVISSKATRINVQQTFDFKTLMKNTACPYQSVTFLAPYDADHLRDPETRKYGQLPEEIFLDAGDTYSFAVHVVSPDLKTDLSTLSLAFGLSRSDYIQVKTSRHVVSERRVMYLVNVTDKGSFTQVFPGESFAVTQLRISVSGENYACKDVDEKGAKTALSHYTTIYSGCPPYQQVFFDWTADKSTQDCPGATADIPCLFFDDAFSPKFSILDKTTGSASPWNDSFSLRIVGGGRDLDTVAEYSREQQSRFNQNSSATSQALIWTTGQVISSDRPIFDQAETHQINWVCTDGSPCNGVRPSRSSPTGDYYFVFEMTTLNVNASSYCIHQTRFTARVYGIPISIHDSLAITLGTLAAGVGLSAVYLLCLWRLEQRDGRRVHPAWGPVHEERFGSIFDQDGSRVFPDGGSEEDAGTRPTQLWRRLGSMLPSQWRRRRLVHPEDISGETVAEQTDSSGKLFALRGKIDHGGS
ncbi:hypothetical protein DFJ73DRAFT_801630, partial [Zopfochytrium polystomum]